MATSIEYSHSPFWPSLPLAGPETPAASHSAGTVICAQAPPELKFLWHDNTATCTWEEVWGALDDGNGKYGTNVASYLSPLINSLRPCFPVIVHNNAMYWFVLLVLC